MRKTEEDGKMAIVGIAWAAVGAPLQMDVVGACMDNETCEDRRAEGSEEDE